MWDLVGEAVTAWIRQSTQWLKVTLTRAFQLLVFSSEASSWSSDSYPGLFRNLNSISPRQSNSKVFPCIIGIHGKKFVCQVKAKLSINYSLSVPGPVAQIHTVFWSSIPVKAVKKMIQLGIFEIILAHLPKTRSASVHFTHADESMR
jgi:hypothetical protein